MFLNSDSMVQLLVHFTKSAILTLLFLITCLSSLLAQTPSSLASVVIGKWSLTRYTETFGGETYNRPIAGVIKYEPKIDTVYKALDQGDTVGTYEFNANQSFTLSSRSGHGITRTIGNWRIAESDSTVTLYNIQTFTVRGPLPKSDHTLDLELRSLGGLFLLLIHYDSGLNSTHQLYYKKQVSD